MNPVTRKIYRLAFCFAALCGIQPTIEVLADPTDRAPQTPMKIHGSVPGSAEIWKQVTAAEQQLKKAGEGAASGKAGASELAKGYSLGEQVVWQVTTLQQFGEPAANDITLRAQLPRLQIVHAIEEFVKTPKGAQYRQTVLTNLTSPKAAAAKQKVVGQLQQLIAKGDLPAAEIQLANAYASLWPFTGFITPYDRGIVFRPFEEVEGTIRSGMANLRRQAGQKVLAERTQQWQAQRDALLQEVTGAAAQLPAAGTISVGGVAMPGPAALASFLQRWGELHLALVQLASMEHALAGTNLQLWREENGKLLLAMEKCLNDVIAAEASAAPPPIARERYVQYLNVLADHVNHVEGWRPESLCAAPLSQLAERAQMTAPVEAYRRASGEMLRWRERFTANQRQVLQTGYVPLHSELHAKLTTTKEAIGVYQENQRHPLPVQNHSIYDLMPRIAEQLGKKKVFAPSVVRLDGNLPFFMTRIQEGVYCRLPSKLNLATSVAGLTNDLVVDADHPPLTLPAATALASANQGEYQFVGGEVAGLELSGYDTRILLLPKIAGPMVSRDTLPAAPKENSEMSYAMDAVALQFNVLPEWVAHRYFVSKVSLANSPAVPASSSASPTASPAGSAPGTSSATAAPGSAPADPSTLPAVTPPVTLGDSPAAVPPAVDAPSGVPISPPGEVPAAVPSEVPSEVPSAVPSAVP